MYLSQSYSRLNQNSVTNELKQLLKNNKGNEANIKGQLLIISKNSTPVINIKIFQPSGKSTNKVSETRK